MIHSPFRDAKCEQQSNNAGLLAGFARDCPAVHCNISRVRPKIHMSSGVAERHLALVEATLPPGASPTYRTMLSVAIMRLDHAVVEAASRGSAIGVDGLQAQV
jgi:hypothetical protein